MKTGKRVSTVGFTFLLAMIRNAINPLLSPPGDLFILNTFEGGRGAGGGGLLEMADLFNSSKMMLSVLHKELQRYLDIMKVQGIGKMCWL